MMIFCSIFIVNRFNPIRLKQQKKNFEFDDEFIQMFTVYNMAIAA